MPDSLTLQTLHRDTIENDLIRLPDYQRDYVWDTEKQAALIASFLIAVPLGSLLLFEGSRGEQEQSFHAKALGRIKKKLPFLPANQEAWYLLDGQQRVTTLMNAFFDLYAYETQGFNQDQKTDHIREMLRVTHHTDHTLSADLRHRWFISLADDHANDERGSLFGYQELDFDLENLSTASFALQLEKLDVIQSEPISNNTENRPYHPLSSDQALKAYCIEMKRIPLFKISNNGLMADILLGIQGAHPNATDDSPWANQMIAFFDILLHGNTELDQREEPDLAQDFGKYYMFPTERIEKRRYSRAFFTFEKRNHAGEALKPFDLLTAKAAVVFYRRNFDIYNGLRPFLSLPEEINQILLTEQTAAELVDYGIYVNNQTLSQTFKQLFVQTLAVYSVYNRGVEIKPFHPKTAWVVSGLLDQEIYDHYRRSAKGLLYAIKFLREILRFYKLTELPFRPMLLPLALIFTINHTPDELTKRRLISWFWCTLFSGEYAKDASTAAAKDANDLISFTQGNLTPRFRERCIDVITGEGLLGYHQGNLNILTLEGAPSDNQTSHISIIVAFTRYLAGPQNNLIKIDRTIQKILSLNPNIYRHPLNYRSRYYGAQDIEAPNNNTLEMTRAFYINRLQHLKSAVTQELQPFYELGLLN